MSKSKSAVKVLPDHRLLSDSLSQLVEPAEGNAVLQYVSQ